MREVKRTHETRRVRVRPESIAKISLARRMPLSSRCHFFSFVYKPIMKNWMSMKKSQKIKSPRKSNPPQHLWGCFEGVFVPDLTRLGMREPEGVFVPDLTRSGVRVRGLGLVWTSGPTRSDRDQHQTRSRTRHRNLTRLVSYVLFTV